VTLALLPLALAASLGVWLLVLLLTRYVSVASIVAALVLPVAAWWLHPSPRIVVVAALIGGLAIYKHRTNIQRLRAGTENRFGKKREEAL
jgi:glycerol-3-phosphate acyltransferase PlsY